MLTLRDVWDFNRKVGGCRLGIEIEVEGSFPFAPPENWQAKPDGSLGPRGVEFVTRQAFDAGRAEELLSRLDKAMKTPGTELNCTPACSVHVHMNVQDLRIDEIVKVLTMYYIFEDVLTNYAGPERVGNLFCLRASDAEEPIHRTVNSINDGRFPGAYGNDIRYAALNLLALQTFGTIEFRAFRAIKKTPMEVLPWVKMLLEIREAALRFESSQEIVEQFSILGVAEFINRVFGKESQKLLDFSDEFGMFECVRRAQWLAYQVNYTKFLSKGDRVKNMDTVRPGEARIRNILDIRPEDEEIGLEENGF